MYGLADGYEAQMAGATDPRAPHDIVAHLLPQCRTAGSALRKLWPALVDGYDAPPPPPAGVFVGLCVCLRVCAGVSVSS